MSSSQDVPGQLAINSKVLQLTDIIASGVQPISRTRAALVAITTSLCLFTNACQLIFLTTPGTRFVLVPQDLVRQAA